MFVTVLFFFSLSVGGRGGGGRAQETPTRDLKAKRDTCFEVNCWFFFRCSISFHCFSCPFARFPLFFPLVIFFSVVIRHKYMLPVCSCNDMGI